VASTVPATRPVKPKNDCADNTLSEGLP
jgi:hypothetical protein